MQILNNLLDSLFPPRQNERILRSLNTLSSQPGIYNEIIYLSSFKDMTCRAAITENKFHNNARAAMLLAKLLDTWLQEQAGNILMVPVPLSKERLKERGYNQVTLIAQNVSCPDAQLLEDVIVRHKDTLPQTSLPKVDRLKNMQGAFTITDKDRLANMPDCTVVILDDVVTTGATLQAVRATLAPHLSPNTKLITLALAH